MKHVVRILVTILILGLVGGGVWYFCFRTKPNEVVFKEVTETKSYLEDEIHIKGIDGKNYYGYDDIIDYFNNNLKKNSDLSYVKINMDNILTPYLEYDDLNYVIINIGKILAFNDISKESIDYYYSLSASAEKVKTGDRKSIVKTINEYNKAIDNFVNSMQDLSDTLKQRINNEQDRNFGTNSIYTDFVKKSYMLLNSLITKQSVQNQLFFNLRDYANKYVFKEFVPDLKSAMYDVYAQQLNILCGELKSKIHNTLDLTNKKEDGTYIDDEFKDTIYTSDCFVSTQTIKGKITTYKNDKTNGFVQGYSSEFLDAYKNLSKENLLAVLKLSNENKQKLYWLGYEIDSATDLGTATQIKFMDETIYNSINDKLSKAELYNSGTNGINTTSYFTDEEKTAFIGFIKDGSYDYDGQTFDKNGLVSIINGNSSVNGITKAQMAGVLKEYLDANITTRDAYMTTQSENIAIAKDILEYSSSIVRYVFGKM